MKKATHQLNSALLIFSAVLLLLTLLVACSTKSNPPSPSHHETSQTERATSKPDDKPADPQESIVENTTEPEVIPPETTVDTVPFDDTTEGISKETIEEETEKQPETTEEESTVVTPIYSKGLNITSNGNGTASVYGIGTCTDTIISIPPITKDGDIVTDVKNSAFENCQSIVQVIIPENVTAIGYSAFSGCKNLERIYISPSVTYIGEYAFFDTLPALEIIIDAANPAYVSSGNCIVSKKDKVLVYGNASTVIPDDGSVVCIGRNAFENCTDLISIVIPDSVTTIMENAFRGCSGLTSITFGKNLRFIDTWAFYNCKNLIAIFDNSDQGFGFDFFKHALMIKNSAGEYTFRSEYEPQGRFKYGIQNDFLYKYNNDEFYLCGYIGPSINIVTLPQDIQGHAYTLNSFSGAHKVLIPEGWVTIPQAAFYECGGLVSVSLPNSITHIEDNAFYGCSDLTNIEFSQSLINIGKYAFSHCTSLTDIKLPDSVRSIEDAAFNMCDRLANIYLPNEIVSIGIYAFNSTAYQENKLNWEDGLLYIGHHLIEARKQDSYNIKPGTLCIADRVFFDNRIKNIIIPPSVTAIGKDAFAQCSLLESVTIYDINLWSQIHFANASSNPFVFAKNVMLNDQPLTEVTLTEGITQISDYAFRGCSSIERVYIPEGVTYIGKLAFSNCNLLKEISVPNSLQTLGWHAFAGCSNISYHIFENCKYFGNQDNPYLILRSMEKDSNITSVSISPETRFILTYAFSSSSITHVTIPAGVISIEDRAFYNCKQLESIIILGNITAIEEETFYDCINLRNFDFPDSLLTIGLQAFENCVQLTDVVIPEGVTHIGSAAFRNCSSLKNVTLPSTLERMDTWPFEACTALTNLYISDIDAWSNIYFQYTTRSDIYTPSNPMCLAEYVYLNGELLKDVTISEGIETIRAGAFHCCQQLTSISLPDTLRNIYIEAFYKCKNLKELKIPDGVAVIPYQMCAYCTQLKSITIPKSVIHIIEDAFLGCNALSDIHYEGTVEEWNNIYKENKWINNQEPITIHCSDGEIII